MVSKQSRNFRTQLSKNLFQTVWKTVLNLDIRKPDWLYRRLRKTWITNFGWLSLSLYCISVYRGQHAYCRLRIRQKRRQRSSLLIGGWNWMLHKSFSPRMIWRKGWIEQKKMCRNDDLENGCSFGAHPTKPFFYFTISSIPPNIFIFY